MKVVDSPYADLLARTAIAQHRVAIDGREVTYWEYGDPASSPTLLFVHGFRGDHHGLEPVIAFLPGVHIIAPDLPGFGRSAELAGEHSIDNYAAWLPKFAAAVGLNADTIVLGHSFGSIVVAASLAAGLPAACAIFVNPIAAPALEGPNRIGTKIALAYYWAGGALPERIGGPLLKSRAVVRGSSIFLAKTRDAGLRSWIHNQHDRFFSDYTSRRVVVESFSASTTHHIGDYVAGIHVPVHFVAAEHDDMTSVAAVEALARRIPGSTMDVIPAVGHLVHYETPRAAAEQIARVAGVSVA